MNNEYEKLKIHFTYCVSILSLVLILVAMDRWTLQPSFTQYLSNVATMTSLVLGLVAIFYAFISNDSLSKSMGNIATVADDVQKSKEKIGEFLIVANDVSKRASDNAQQMQAVSSAVEVSVASLKETLQIISSKTDELHSAISVLPTRFEKLENRFEETSKLMIPSAPPPKTDWSSADVQSFFERSPLSCNLLTYACVKSKESGKDLSITELRNAIDTGGFNYLKGFLSAMNATGIVRRVILAGEDGLYKINHIDNLVHEGIQQYLVGYITRRYSEGEREEWMTKVYSIDKLFET